MAVSLAEPQAPDRPKVLIVDDQPSNLDVLEAMLGDSGCTLVRASSADEALLCLVRHDFAALVLDIRMPGMSGLELASLIKGRKRSQDIPILFLTAHSADEGDVLRGYSAGAVDYLSKPINAEILRSKVSVFVDAFRKTRALSDLNAALQREVAQREEAQAALQLANQDLERRVQERTAALTRAHQGVRENEERLRMALEVAQIGAWEWHLSSGQMRWSADPEVLFGFPKGSFGPDLRLARVVHRDDCGRIEDATAVALKTGIYEAEYRVIRPDGGIVWITERGRVFSDADGERMVGISRDVTAERESTMERERLLRSERQSRDEAERQSRLKDEFLATLSHELRTPMNVMLGWLEILAAGTPIRDLPSMVAVLQRNARLQAKLIDDLLDMNRLTSGNLHLELSQVDLAAALHATVHGLSPAAAAKDVELNVSAEPPSIEIEGDGRRIQQILWNVVHNAIKFTPAGGRVDATARRAADHVEIVVHDTGHGISSQFLPHVFERFRQEDSSTTREWSGLGLGLSIARHLVELHGGHISAHSDGPGRGATFVIRFPIAGDHPEFGFGGPRHA
jgi:signal transduction histidine kinase/CheY-like chemotaxis protein